MKYVPLRIHSVFSQGKGAVDAAELGDFLSRKSVPFLAVTDPFSMAGWESFRENAVKRGMKPLPGMEIRVQKNGALLLYPLSVKGYLSLVASFNQKVISKMDEVIVVYIPHRTVSKDFPTFMSIYKLIVPENFYLGLEWNSNRGVIDLSKKHGIPLVWAQPVKWVMNPEKYAVVSSVFKHHSISDVLMGAKSGELPMYGPMNDYAVTKRWGDAGCTAMKNTFVVASRVGFDFSDISARVDSPQLLSPSTAGIGRSPWNPGELLAEAVNREVAKRSLTIAERERTSRELKIIKEQGFAVYFLIASEIGDYCRKNNIYFNLRGSSVSSFILYLLGLSRVNPIEFDLLFERFVNSLRDDLPDIDIDIDSSRRSQVLKWVFERYDKRVIFVSTHKFFRARSALYEVARASGFNAEESHKMCKGLPMYASPSMLNGKGRGKMAEVYTMAALLKGVYKEYSLHLGGVLFSGEEVGKVFPMEISPDGFGQIVWDKDTVERLRIFKLDLLGVRGFDVIAPVALKGGVDFNDPEVWENIRSARTVGCFQLESPLVRETLLKVRPCNLHELAVAIAIIRPGPAQAGMKRAYTDEKPPIHPVLDKIFPRTRGNLIFEDQVSVLLHTVTGWNLERAEKIRRDLKKGKGAQYKEEFLSKGRGSGWKDTDLEAFWKLADDFSRYTFNQGHSVSYAYSSYLSAWFKTRYSVTFFCRLLNAGGGYYSLPVYIEETRKWGIRLLPPDINFSVIGFKEEKGAIRIGLNFVKGVGMNLAANIVNNRGLGYSTLEDFIARTAVGERDFSTLMAVSAFSSLGHNGFTPQEREKNWKEYLGFVP